MVLCTERISLFVNQEWLELLKENPMQRQTLVATLVVAVLALSMGTENSAQKPTEKGVSANPRPIICRLQYAETGGEDEDYFNTIEGMRDFPVVGFTYFQSWIKHGNPSNSGWGTDFPYADRNMGKRLSELTKISVDLDREGNPATLALEPNDPRIFRCPVVLASDVGAMKLRPKDVDSLRAYLQKGGFLWADDFWGTSAWNSWIREISRVLPPSQYKVEDLSPLHPLFQTFFLVSKVPQIVDLNTWEGGLSQEVEGPDGAEVHIRAIFDSKGQMMVLMTHNTDIQNGWEREWSPEYQDFFWLGYPLGVNAVLYALSH